MNIRRPPYVFTEHGVAMLSSVLRSERAVQLNILIIRGVIASRVYATGARIWRRKLEDGERTQQEHNARLQQFSEAVHLFYTESSPKKPYDASDERAFQKFLSEWSRRRCAAQSQLRR